MGHTSGSIWLIGVLVCALTACTTETVLQPGGPSATASQPSQQAPSTSPATRPRPATSPTLPYRADWSSGPAGWTGTDDWTVAGGQLHNDGTSYRNSVGMVAPLDLAGVRDYAVDAEIQLLRYSDSGMISGRAAFGVVVRAQQDGVGYNAGPCVSSGIYTCADDQPSQRVAGLWADEARTTLDVRPFRPGEDWHHYRVEVRGNTIVVLIDGRLALSATDNTYLEGRKIGLWSSRCQISVRSFEVTAL
jgi:hypothetical protein